MGYDEWHKEYLEKKIVNIKNELDTKDLKILSKLNIKIEDKVYTEYELETLTVEVGAYYKDDHQRRLCFGKNDAGYRGYLRYPPAY